MSNAFRPCLEPARKPCALALITGGINTSRKFHVHSPEIYWLTQGGISQSTVWTLPEIKALKLPPSTVRNRNTLERLAAKYRFVGDGG